ncbi:hypothetical protein NDU88_000932, partial [Pleurodeles waltl]
SSFSSSGWIWKLCFQYHWLVQMKRERNLRDISWVCSEKNKFISEKQQRFFN